MYLCTSNMGKKHVAQSICYELRGLLMRGLLMRGLLMKGLLMKGLLWSRLRLFMASQTLCCTKFAHNHFVTYTGAASAWQTKDDHYT